MNTKQRHKTMPCRIDMSSPYRNVRGYGYEFILPDTLSEYDNIEGCSLRSPLVLYENGKQLLGQHASTTNIWYSGGGHYTHYGNKLYFSSLDNSNPNTNGRLYHLEFVEGRGPAYSLPFPPRVHLTLSNVCNLWCRICREKKLAGPTMDMNLFYKIAEEVFPHTVELRLDSGGELLLNKNFKEILATVKKYNVAFRTSTNGMLLTPDRCRLIAESTLHDISISLDSPKKHTLEWIRRGANFEQIIQGVKNLVAARKEVGRPFLIGFHAAIMQENVRQLPDLVRLAHSLGIEGVTGCHLFAHSHMPIESSCFWAQEEYNEWRERAIAVARSLNSYFYGPYPFSVEEQGQTIDDSISKKCDYPEYGTYICPDGIVVPCCVSDFKLGDLHQQSFTEIWNGELYQKFRETYRTRDSIVEKCKTCLVKKNCTQDYKSYFASVHWPMVRKRLQSMKKS